MSNWAAVWGRVDARRIALGLPQKALATASTVSESTFRKMKAGTPLERADKRAALCRALGWEPDGIDRLLAGLEPVVSLPDESGSLERRVSVLEAELATLRAELYDALGGVVAVQRAATAATRPQADPALSAAPE